MDAQLSLKDLMNPTRLDMQARFNNAQIAVDMAYRIAEKNSYLADVKTLNPNWKEGDASYDKYDYTEAAPEAKIAKVVELARMLKPEIEKDLNDTLKVLDGTSSSDGLSKEVTDGAKSDTAKLS